ncbi:MAG: DUF1289 domain-containing protein [Ferrovibrio sp.]
MIEPPARTDDDPPSPCTKVCSIDRRSGWCLGCYRSGEEIGAWPTMPAGEKHALLARLPARRQSMATAGKR